MTLSKRVYAFSGAKRIVPWQPRWNPTVGLLYYTGVWSCAVGAHHFRDSAASPSATTSTHQCSTRHHLPSTVHPPAPNMTLKSPNHVYIAIHYVYIAVHSTLLFIMSTFYIKYHIQYTFALCGWGTISCPTCISSFHDDEWIVMVHPPPSVHLGRASFPSNIGSWWLMKFTHQYIDQCLFWGHVNQDPDPSKSNEISSKSP